MVLAYLPVSILPPREENPLSRTHASVPPQTLRMPLATVLEQIEHKSHFRSWHFTPVHFHQSFIGFGVTFISLGNNYLF